MKDGLREVVILGGGITGLTTAFYLKQYSAEAGIPLRIRIVEKSPRLGGKIHTLEREGFTIEKGADSFLARKRPIIDLALALGLEQELTGQGAKGKRSYFLQRGQFFPAPKGMVLGVPTDLDAFMETDLVSAEGKARVLKDLDIPKREEPGDESLGGFLARRLGTEMVENVAEPLLAGIYAGDLFKLSLAATFPQFKEAEERCGSLIKGMQEDQRTAKPPADQPEAARNSAFLSFNHGLDTLVKGLLRALDGVEIATGTGAVRIHKDAAAEISLGQADQPPAYQVELEDGNRLAADVMIVTVPTYEYPGLLPAYPGLGKLAELPYISVANVVLAFDEAEAATDFDGAGFVISRKEGRFITACTWTSSKWVHTAPPGRMLLRCYVGRAGDQEWVKLSDEELVAGVRREVADLMHITAEPLFHEVTRLYRSMPNYPVGHLENVQAARSELAADMPGVYVTGAAFDGVGLPDCIRQGRDTAAECLAFLRK
ncbi:protoporphyrinogen oxidase [Gorillibacterium massiliense]|uniref:protoporphyrinogen oxidase n=1 Tax=Gorillibacterium massiliense TaxID=1280390 RepID=UPI0004B0F67C|nr:protoporphyrinogen oxidase [Gorillibacterium massiliense]